MPDKRISLELRRAFEAFAKKPGTPGETEWSGDSQEPEHVLARTMMEHACRAKDPARHLEEQLHELRRSLQRHGHLDIADETWLPSIIGNVISATAETYASKVADSEDCKHDPNRVLSDEHAEKAFGFARAGLRFAARGGRPCAVLAHATEAVEGLVFDSNSAPPCTEKVHELLLDILHCLGAQAQASGAADQEALKEIRKQLNYFVYTSDLVRFTPEKMTSFLHSALTLRGLRGADVFSGFPGLHWISWSLKPCDASGKSRVVELDQRELGVSTARLKAALACPDMGDDPWIQNRLGNSLIPFGHPELRAAAVQRLSEASSTWEPGLRGRLRRELEKAIAFEHGPSSLGLRVPDDRKCLPAAPQDPAAARRFAMAQVSDRRPVGEQAAALGLTDDSVKAALDPLSLLPVQGPPSDGQWALAMEGLTLPAALTPERQAALCARALDGKALLPRQRLDAIGLLAGCERFFPTPEQVSELRLRVLDIGLGIAGAAQAGEDAQAGSVGASKVEISAPPAQAQAAALEPARSGLRLVVESMKQLSMRQLASAGLHPSSSGAAPTACEFTPIGDIEAALDAVMLDKQRIQSRLDSTPNGAAQRLMEDCLEQLAGAEKHLRAAGTELAG